MPIVRMRNKYDSATTALWEDEAIMAHILSKSNNFAEFRNLMLEYLRTGLSAKDRYDYTHYLTEDNQEILTHKQEKEEQFFEKVDSMPYFSDYSKLMLSLGLPNWAEDHMPSQQPPSNPVQHPSKIPILQHKKGGKTTRKNRNTRK
uniref:Uncharacterized protein n=1 Tax=viral metagenome TaxID=1070528 RepID=A0A6C0E0Z8_9ZZZZ